MVCQACFLTWGCESPVQLDGGEGLAKRKGICRPPAEYASHIGARRGIISGATAAEVQQVAQGHPDVLGSNSWSVPQILTISLNGRSTLLTERVAMMSETIADEGTPSADEVE